MSEIIRRAPPATFGSVELNRVAHGEARDSILTQIEAVWVVKSTYQVWGSGLARSERNLSLRAWDHATTGTAR